MYDLKNYVSPFICLSAFFSKYSCLRAATRAGQVKAAVHASGWAFGASGRLYRFGFIAP